MPGNADNEAAAAAQTERMDQMMQMLTGMKTSLEGVDAMAAKVDALEKRIAEIQTQPASAIAAAPGRQSPVQPPVLPTGPQTTQFRRLDVKLTEFNAEKVDRWFKETDRALAAANVTDSTHKVAIIQKYIPDHIRDTKQDIFATERYDDVKQAVIKAVQKSDEERYKAYMTAQLGDRKPSEGLAEQLSHVPMDAQDFQDFIVKQRFLASIPAELAQHLQGHTFTLRDGQHAASVENYVRRVDELFSLGNLSKKRNAMVGSVEDADDDEATVNAIMNRMGKEKFRQKFGGSPNKGASSQQRRRSGSGTRVGNWADKLCYMHKNHGDKAYHCAKTDTCPMAKTLAPKPEQTKKK